MTELLGYHAELVRKGIFKGVDLASLVETFWRLEAMRVDEKCSAPSVRWRAYAFGGAWGTAWVAMRDVVMRLSPGATVESAAEVLLHEMVHCACPPREHHGELFCRRLIAAAREAFGVDLDSATLLELKAGQHGRRAYAIDHAIVEAMKAAGVAEKLRARAPFEPPPPETEEQIAARIEARRSKLMEERARHAKEMLEEWEKRAARARKRALTWRRKVRYYEKRELMAAKKREASGGGEPC